jgi:predicted dehydrogenase
MNSSSTPLKFPVLVVGFGKIGAIKSEIWKSLGAEVYVYDVSPSANKRIIEAGYTPFTLLDDTTIKELIVDISTPAAKHATALDWALSTLSVCPRIILLEKPLVSSEAELAVLLDVLKSNPDVNLQHIFVNESYYASTALRKVKELVGESGESIQGLTVDLSKNRIMDNDNGRFFDYELGAIGIEMPHMIAIAQYM